MFALRPAAETCCALAGRAREKYRRRQTSENKWLAVGQADGPADVRPAGQAAGRRCLRQARRPSARTLKIATRLGSAQLEAQVSVRANCATGRSQKWKAQSSISERGRKLVIIIELLKVKPTRMRANWSRAGRPSRSIYAPARWPKTPAASRLSGSPDVRSFSISFSFPFSRSLALSLSLPRRSASKIALCTRPMATHFKFAPCHSGRRHIAPTRVQRPPLRLAPTWAGPSSLAHCFPSACVQRAAS